MVAQLSFASQIFCDIQKQIPTKVILITLCVRRLKGCPYRKPTIRASSTLRAVLGAAVPVASRGSTVSSASSTSGLARQGAGDPLVSDKATFHSKASTPFLVPP
jgi:hypothetical protein